MRRLILAWLLTLVLAGGAEAACSFVRVASSSALIGGSNSLTYAIDATGGDYLTVGVGIGDRSASGRVVSGVTYNGVAMTNIVSQADTTFTAGQASLWGLIAPDTGSHDVVVSVTGDTDIQSGAILFTGVHQTVPTGTPGAAHNSTGTTASTTVTDSVTGDCVVDAVNSGDAIGAGNVGAGQNSRWAIDQNTASAGGNGAGSTEPGASGTVTMSWTVAEVWQIVAVAVKQAAGAGSTQPPRSMHQFRQR